MFLLIATCPIPRQNLRLARQQWLLARLRRGCCRRKGTAACGIQDECSHHLRALGLTESRDRPSRSRQNYSRRLDTSLLNGGSAPQECALARGN